MTDAAGRPVSARDVALRTASVHPQALLVAARRAAVAGLIAMSVLALSACAGESSDADRATWVAWADAATTGADAISGAASLSNPSEATTLTFAAPTAAASVELACIGSDSMSFTLIFTGADSSVSEREDIVCRDGAYRTPIATPDAVGELTSFAANASSSDGQGYWVAALQP